MKDENNLIRSRNARLNLVHRAAKNLVTSCKPEHRPDNDEAWSALFADIRDMAADVHQGVHEASAYHNVLKDAHSSTVEPPAHNGLVDGSTPSARTSQTDTE